MSQPCISKLQLTVCLWDNKGSKNKGQERLFSSGFFLPSSFPQSTLCQTHKDIRKAESRREGEEEVQRFSGRKKNLFVPPQSSWPNRLKRIVETIDFWGVRNLWNMENHCSITLPTQLANVLKTCVANRSLAYWNKIQRAKHGYSSTNESYS